MAKPLLFVTGFFGAGKTTLLRTLASGLQQNDYSADVILNDFADAGLDAATLEDKVASISPIASSCACCEGMEELMSLCQAASRASGDVLLIELNGSADPLPILEAFTLTSHKFDFSPRIQVNLIDGRLWGKRNTWDPIEKRQLETAGTWILSHQEAIDEQSKSRIIEEVSKTAPYAKETNPAELLSSLIEHIKEASASNGSEDSIHLPTSSCAPHSHSVESDPVHQLSHHFEGWMVPLPNRVRKRSVQNLLSALPEWVIRAKMIVKLIEEPGGKWLFQRSHSDLISQPIHIPGAEHITSSLVCIGPTPDTQLLSKLVCEHFGGEAEALLNRVTH